MQLAASELLLALDAVNLKRRESLAHQPGLALVWVGNDAQTAAFVRVKQRKAQKLNCQFFLHHFDVGDERQLDATIKGLNQRPDIHGIVVQLPLPPEINSNELVNIINPAKDVDGLTPDSPFPAPTATGIVQLLQANQINLANRKTVILGAGPLVGAPLAALFKKNGWPFTQIIKKAETQTDVIRKNDLLISCTGVTYLVQPEMVNPEMIVVDGSGIDVDVAQIEPLVAAVTPTKGAIGPLTVTNLFTNLLVATT
jgi:methylenetetrahydrofolate dehydrogenase (NADP+)/methenyltetrahydrofolate cyclohydrolase